MWIWALTMGCTPQAGLAPTDSSPAPAVPPPAPTTPTGTTIPEPTPRRLVFDGPVPTNLLVISLDTTRRDALGRYGGGTDTPFLDGLLAQSVVLDDHYSCSNWTGPSMMCATSGLGPVDVGAMRPLVVADRLPTVARVLGEQAGFTSRLVSANPFFFGANDALGFDEVTTLAGVEPGRAERVNDLLLTYLDEIELEGAGPWYAHAHYFDPHDPYCPPEAYRIGEDALPSVAPFDICRRQTDAVNALWNEGTPSQRDALLQNVEFLYRAEMRYLDDSIAALWADLEARGTLDDALVVFWTDHGEQLFERDQIGHNHQLFAEETRAAAAFWARNLTPGTVQVPTTHEDLAATLYPLFGTSPKTPPTGRPLDEVTADRALGLVQVMFPFNTVAVVTGRRQLTLGYDDTRTFHDVTRDPAMLEDRYNPASGEVLDAWSAMDALLDRVEGAFPLWNTHDRTP